MMNQKNILSSIIEEIYQLESYVQGWRDIENVPSIEKDLVQRKLQQIYDHIKRLNTEVNPITEEKPVVIKEEPTINVQAPEITIPGPVNEIVFDKTMEIIEEPKPIIHEIPLKTEPVKQVIEVTVSKTKVETEVEQPKVSGKEILSEKLTQTHKVINETVKTRTVMDVSSKFKTAPIPSIQSAINLNDKFVFIRELFKNNNLLYNQTIERLNNSNSSEEAISIIEKEFAWDLNEPLVYKLVELIKRKHNA
jgi:hypothetical protein